MRADCGAAKVPRIIPATSVPKQDNPNYLGVHGLIRHWTHRREGIELEVFRQPNPQIKLFGCFAEGL